MILLVLHVADCLSPAVRHVLVDCILTPTLPAKLAVRKLTTTTVYPASCVTLHAELVQAQVLQCALPVLQANTLTVRPV